MAKSFGRTNTSDAISAGFPIGQFAGPIILCLNAMKEGRLILQLNDFGWIQTPQTGYKLYYRRGKIHAGGAAGLTCDSSLGW